MRSPVLVTARAPNMRPRGFRPSAFLLRASLTRSRCIMIERRCAPKFPRGRAGAIARLDLPARSEVNIAIRINPCSGFQKRGATRKVARGSERKNPENINNFNMCRRKSGHSEVREQCPLMTQLGHWRPDRRMRRSTVDSHRDFGIRARFVPESLRLRSDPDSRGHHEQDSDLRYHV